MTEETFDKLVNLLDLQEHETKSRNSTWGIDPICKPMVVLCGLRFLGGESPQVARRRLVWMCKWPLITYSSFNLSVLQHLGGQTIAEHIGGVRNCAIISSIYQMTAILHVIILTHCPAKYSNHSKEIKLVEMRSRSPTISICHSSESK
jgi:hypothetical protein